MLENMRKSLLERAHSIFNYLKTRNEFVYKTELKVVGLDANSSENWVQLIQFIQSQPKLLVKRAGKYTTIKLESEE